MTTILGVSVKVWYRRTIQLILGLFVLVTAVSGMLVANAALGDWQISRDRGVAVAEVVTPATGPSASSPRYWCVTATARRSTTPRTAA